MKRRGDIAGVAAARTGVSETEAPYPLLRRFSVLVLPPLVLALGGFLGVVAFALGHSVERAYESEAASQHALLVGAVDIAGWADQAAADHALEAETAELGLRCAVIEAADGSQLGAGAECPTLSAEDREDLAASRTIFREVYAPSLGWMVASRQASATGPVKVITLADARQLEALIGTSSMLWVGGLALALLAAMAVALVLIVRAQREIDRRTTALNEARSAIARFVSRHTQASALGDLTARRAHTTVLFLDIRDFSSFADQVPPEEAAELVTRVAKIGFTAVLANGGDVDRLVGDGLVARFDGKDRVARAFTAASTILARTAAADLPRGVGIGLIEGDVVEATIAVGERADATILGRTVNLCARLCSAAGPGEIVASATMSSPPGIALVRLGTETLKLKGHGEPFRAERYALGGAASR